MTKREICENNPAIAYYSGLGGLEVHFIEYGIDDHLYVVSGAWNGRKRYHRLKVKYTENDSYIVLHGYKCKLSDFLRV